MEEWRFVIEDNTEQSAGIDSGVSDILGSGANEKPRDKKSNKGFIDTVAQKSSEKLIEQTMVSPLNTATGGLANPLYKGIKRVATGGKLTAGVIGAISVNLAISGIRLAVNKIEARMQELQKQVTELNNNDNALIRAGSVSQATYYSANLLGIKKTTNRS